MLANNLVVLASVLSAAFAANLKDRSYYEERFFNWLATHEMKPQDGKEFVHWLENFSMNDDKIETHNAGNHSWWMGHNKFSHMNADEWRTYVHSSGPRPEPKEPPVSIIPDGELQAGSSIDWTTKGAVTGVKDQGYCGSCWAFSTTGALEGGVVAVQHGSLLSLSEQELVDCDNRSNGGSDLGCNGGLMDSAFDWTSKHGGICSESAYPYTSGTTRKSGTCNMNSCGTKYAKNTGHIDCTKNSESSLITALNTQPVSVAIEADQASFQSYKGGIFDGTCGTNLDHGVLAVGYTDEYWKVKNSWGTSWGEQGYIRLSRKVKQSGGQCGILLGPPSIPKW